MDTKSGKIYIVLEHKKLYILKTVGAIADMNRPKKPTIVLMVENSPDEQNLTRKALEQSRFINEVQVVEDGEQLLNYLYRRGQYKRVTAPRPNLILLDLYLPKIDGLKALQEIKADPDLRRIPIVVLTPSKVETDIYRSYELGASSYIPKPATFEALLDVMDTLGRYWFGIVELPPAIAES